MNLKRALILAPALLCFALVQAYWWVPGYASLSQKSERRLGTFIETSSGDAKLLNPILNADTSSSRIADLVFDGLLDLDENLNLRGRLAASWTIDETAELIVRPDVAIADGNRLAASELVLVVEQYLRSHAQLGSLVQQVRLLPGDSKPQRIEITLSKVSQDLDRYLAPLLGSAYYDKYQTPLHTAELPTAVTSTAAPAAQPAPNAKRPDTEPAVVAVLRHKPRIRFVLRPDVRFHDGHVFDAGDVVFTYQAIMEARNLSPRTSNFEPIERIEVVDNLTIDVIYKRLFAPAIEAWTMGILPEHLLNESARQKEIAEQRISAQSAASFGMRQFSFNRKPVGTGPFRFTHWDSDEQIRLTRNEDYWEGAPQLSDYYFRVLPDPLTREIEFRTGAADTYAPQPHQAARYLDDEAYQSFSNPALGYSYIGYNLRREPFKDPRVRRALGMAIDTEEIIRFVLYGEGERTTGPYPVTTPWYDRTVTALPYDPQAARALLADAGWQPNSEGWLAKDGKVLTFNLITNNGNPVRKSIMAIAQDAWRSIGVKVNTQVFEWAVFLEDFINPGEFDAVILGWRTGIDFDQFQIWHSSQTGANQLNFVGYQSPAADKLMLRLRQEYDPEVQRELAHALHRRIAADQPYTFLFAGKVTRVLDRTIKMRRKDGTLAPIRVSSGGDVFIHMNRWARSAHAP